MLIFLTVFLTAVVAGTIMSGVYLNSFKGELCESAEKRQKLNKFGKFIFGLNIQAVIGAFIVGVIWIITGGTAVAEAQEAVQAGAMSVGEGIRKGLGYLGAGISTGCASIGAGVGAGVAGAAGIGAISEKPEMLGKSLIYIGLAEGVAIYGLLISFMIFAKI